MSQQIENIEIEELSDSELEGASGGDAASRCCCSTTGGDCSNPPKEVAIS